MTEAEAHALVWKAVEEAGGPRSIYRNPRMAYSAQSRRLMEVDGHTVELRYGEISTPAIASIAGWVYEIHDEDIELLLRPAGAKKSPQS